MKRHRWRAIVTYKIDDEQAAIMHAPAHGLHGSVALKPGQVPPQGVVVLRPSMVDTSFQPVVACLVCEQPWLEARQTPCPGEPWGYEADGTPVRVGATA